MDGYLRQLNAEEELQRQEDELRTQLINLALAQNPELARQMLELNKRKNEAKIATLYEGAKVGRDIEQKRKDETVSQRKISYNDKVNKNKLSAIRRWNKHLSLDELHIKEYEEYYKPYGIEPPIEVKASLGLVKKIA